MFGYTSVYYPQRRLEWNFHCTGSWITWLVILHSYSSQQSGCSTEGAHPLGFLPQISITDSSADTKLIEWLRNLQLDQGSIDKASNSHW